VQGNLHSHLLFEIYPWTDRQTNWPVAVPHVRYRAREKKQISNKNVQAEGAAFPFWTVDDFLSILTAIHAYA